MQKVIRRAFFAEKQAARRTARKKERSTRSWLSQVRRETKETYAQEVKQLRAAQTARREDWELGPLAPRRDVGNDKAAYGTVDQNQLRLRMLDYDRRAEALKSIGGRFLNIVKGDRVVLLEGRDKGKIGKITEVDLPRAACRVEGLNMADIAVPEWMRKLDKENPSPIRSMESQVPLTSVRLVFPLTDAETGETRDVIVKKLVNTAFFRNKDTGRTHWKRVIPGLNLVVPWPKLQPTEKKNYDVDTLRMEVETRTFVPTLLRPPMPGSVIDELRNKFSKFRTRHDPEYVEAKMQEDRDAEARKQLSAEMRTPLQEINRKERKLRRAKGKGKLTSEMLERLGRAIARKKELALGPAEPPASMEGAALAA